MDARITLFASKPSDGMSPKNLYDSESPMHGELKSRRYRCFLKLVTLCGRSSAPKTLHRSSDRASLTTDKVYGDQKSAGTPGVKLFSPHTTIWA